jgi:3-isopropylmalate/(R)-2-methylmalate dehydratase small subunit
VTLEPIERIVGRGVAVRGNDIDTDQIIPARFMKEVTFAGLEDHIFEDLRADSQERGKEHPFDDGRYGGASILVANKNFGCGSSREHAPQALRRWGIRAIVGESFAEIFFGNCVAIGVPPVTASREDVTRLMEALELDPDQELELDLQAKTLGFARGIIRVEIPEGARKQLLEGSWDATATMLTAREMIDRTAKRLPYVTGF